MYCKTNQFSALTFCGPYFKPRGARGLSNHYHLRFDTKLGNGICTILRIPCACVTFTSMLDKPCISDITSDEQDCYKPVTKCTYFPLLGSFNSWNIIILSQKSTPSDEFDEIYQVALDLISDNMALLAGSGKYGAINTTDTKIMDFMISCSHQKHIHYKKHKN